MILKLIVGIVLLYLVYRLIGTLKRPSGTPKAPPPVTGEDLVEDPVCHTYVPVTHARRAEIDGKIVYFCSEKCLEQYKIEQQRQ
jgi:YHS domain-containing protein